MEDVFEFDIEKVESLNFEEIKSQLKYIFKTEQDIVNFVNFLKNIKNFVNLSNDKRHMTLMDLCFFKSQILQYENKIKSLLLKKKNQQLKESFKKAKCVGEKITENTLAYFTEDNSAVDNLELLLNLVSSWTAYMQDLYYMCGQTNKNLGSLY